MTTNATFLHGADKAAESGEFKAVNKFFWGGAICFFLTRAVPVFIATGIGQLPATIVYSWAGSLLTGGTFWFVTGLFILFALSVIISVARCLYLEHQRKKT